MTDRRTFIRQISTAGLVTGLTPGIIPVDLPEYKVKADLEKNEKIWACLLHLSFNFAGGIRHWVGIRKEFEPEQSVWDTAIQTMVAQKINTVLINLDDSVLWRSHPEISLKNAWTPEKLREELAKIRKLGIEPIPMLNFATTHDAWLGKYSRMVSTTPYYKVCKDLIAEAIEIFDNPRFIHLGMDEEDYNHQKHFDYIVIRQKELWWGDLYFYISEALSKRVRPWVWSDYVWQHPDEFFKMMPKSVIQSNRYYGNELDPENTRVRAYLDLEREGYDQIPTASYHAVPPRNFEATNENSIQNTVTFCRKHISDIRLMGFMQTLWMPTIGRFSPTINKAIDLIGKAKRNFENE